MPVEVDECVQSIMTDNPDMSEDTAHAICQDMKNRGVLADYLEAAPEGSALAIHTLEEPGTITRTEEGDDRVRYEDVMLLSPGVWTDAASQQPIHYSERGIRNSHTNWEDTTLNFLHEQEDEIWQIGEVDDESAYVDDEGRLFADLVLDTSKASGELADEALETALETGGKQGIEGPSVEITGHDYEFDRDAGVKELVEGTFRGAALVGVGISPGPASKTASFEHQTDERAVALQSSDGELRILRLNNAGEESGVSTVPDDVPTEAAEWTHRLQESDVTKQEIADIVADAYEGLDPATVLSILDDAQEEMGDDDEDEEELETHPDDEEEEDEEDMADNDEEDDEDEEEDEVNIDLTTLQDRLEALSERITKLEDALPDEEILASNEDLEDIEARIQNLEDMEEDPDSLAEGADPDSQSHSSNTDTASVSMLGEEFDPVSKSITVR